MFSPVPDKALGDKRLKLGSRLLLGVIVSYDNGRFGCIAKNTTMADRMSVEPRSIQRYIAELKKYGYISINLDEPDTTDEVRIITICDKVLTSPQEALKNVRYEKKLYKEKNLLPHDIDVPWLDEYIKNIK